MGPDKAWEAQQDLGARYRPSYPLENFFSEALRMSDGCDSIFWRRVWRYHADKILRKSCAE